LNYQITTKTTNIMKKLLLLLVITFISINSNAQIGMNYDRFKINPSYFSFKSDTMAFEINEIDRYVTIIFVNNICTYIKFEFTNKKIANKFLNATEIKNCYFDYGFSNKKYYCILSMNDICKK